MANRVLMAGELPRLILWRAWEEAVRVQARDGLSDAHTKRLAGTLMMHWQEWLA